MIETIIFDFGNVFINLDLQATHHALLRLGNYDPKDLVVITKEYETGRLTTQEFLTSYQKVFPKASLEQLTEAWNAILLDFPKHRFHFIKKLAKQKQYRLILLSNTNKLHIDWIAAHVPFYEDFKACFSKFYLSHEIHLRKPTTAIFEYVIRQQNITPSKTLFIDDTSIHTTSVYKLGIHTWAIKPTSEDIVDLFDLKSYLF